MSEETKAPWMLDEGLDGDMSGDAGFRGNSMTRFRMKKASDTSIIFLTDGPKFRILWEHEVKIAGFYGNFFGCLQMLGLPCPLCQLALSEAPRGVGKRYKICVATIVHLTEYTDKKGAVHKNERRFFCAKAATVEILNRKYRSRVEAGQTLKYAMYKVARTSNEKGAAVGEDFEFVKMIDPAALPDATELDYSTFAPNPALVKTLIGSLPSAESFGSKPDDFHPPGTDSTDDSVKY